ncbi:hypothetical protein SPH9361_04762 [Sphingobium sp. CECT 9361]|nr:hypothetical protein SPH9361_04762 [Sphingobium sp. CECT 9361]
MPLTLSPGVSYCLVAGRTIFLDLVNDRYQSARHDLFDTEIAEVELDQLRRRGLIMGEGRFSAPPPLPDTLEPLADDKDAVTQARAMDCAMAMRAQLRATYRLHRRGLSRSINVLLSNKIADGDLAGELEDGHRQTAAAFAKISPFFTNSRACLTRSLALVDRLTARRLGAALIIGVKAAPFSAHAWVQAGHTVLNDSFDVVREYSPIAKF